MLKLSIAWAALVLIVALTLVTAAKADYVDPGLGRVATIIAGHPVTVSCAADSTDWATIQKGHGLSFDTDGFTFTGTPVIYLAPRICDTLEADLHVGVASVGDYWNGLAIKAFIHENIHQRGVKDEGVTDCTALSLVKTYALSFGYAPTAQSVTYKRLASGLYKRTVKTVPNPALAKVYSWASVWHKRLPAAYQGTC